MLHTGWIYQSKNSDKCLVLGYKKDAFCYIIECRKPKYELFCNKEYEMKTIGDEFMYSVLQETNFKDLILSDCYGNDFVLIYKIIEEDENDILNNPLNPLHLTLVSSCDYEKSIDETKNIKKLDDTKVKQWYIKNKLLYQNLYDYLSDVEVDIMLLDYTKSTKEQFQSAKKYYFRYAFEKLYQKVKDIRIIKSSDEKYVVYLRKNKILTILNKKASKEQNVLSYMRTVTYQYYNPTAYIKDYVETKTDKIVEKYEDL